MLFHRRRYRMSSKYMYASALCVGGAVVAFGPVVVTPQSFQRIGVEIRAGREKSAHLPAAGDGTILAIRCWQPLQTELGRALLWLGISQR